ncbi:MAG: protein serine/threonine phosphatase, partial [Thermoleophilia bacterium]|nr:protein serine/threonine phosphatase [Thermoleophilia bacterium]
MSAMLEMPHAAQTDVGRRREHNEDALVARPPLIAVADGVGGSAKGEVASQLALDTFVERVAAVSTARTAREATEAMETAVLAANTAVHEAQLRDDQLRGMATTLTAAVARDGGEVVVGHVGDSRLYVVSAAGARQASSDHSVVAELVRSGRLPAEEAAHHPQRNAITRALGPEPDVTVDAFTIHVGPGDWLLTCSDGLTEHVADGELARALLEDGRRPAAALARLVDLANERGGTDNISVAIIQPVPSDVSGELSIEALQTAAASTSQITIPEVSDAPAERSGPLPAVDLATEPMHHDEELAQARGRSSTRGRTIAVLGLVLVLAAVAGAFTWSQSYFLIERQDGTVGVNRGFPFARLASPHR